MFSWKCCGSWKKQDTLQVLQFSHPVAYSRVPAFLRIDKTLLEALKKARNNSLVNRMVDEYDKTGWESPWHRASQQLHALKKMLACPSTEQEPRNFLFLSPLKQISNLVSYSLPLRDENWEMNREKSPAIYFHYLGSAALAKAFPTTFLEVQELQKLVLKLDFPLSSSTFLGTSPFCCQGYKKWGFPSSRKADAQSQKDFSQGCSISQYFDCAIIPSSLLSDKVSPRTFSLKLNQMSSMLWMFQKKQNFEKDPKLKWIRVLYPYQS